MLFALHCNGGRLQKVSIHCENNWNTILSVLANVKRYIYLLKLLLKSIARWLKVSIYCKNNWNTSLSVLANDNRYVSSNICLLKLSILVQNKWNFLHYQLKKIENVFFFFFKYSNKYATTPRVFLNLQRAHLALLAKKT